MNYRYTLTYNSVSEVLTLNPENWDAIGINYVRSDVYHGFVRREMVTSLRFPIKTGGGGQFIIDAYEDAGIEAEVIINIDRRNSQTWAFDNIFTGILNLKPEQFSIDKENRFVEVSIIDSMKQNKFLTRDEINYNIFDLVSSDNIIMDDFLYPSRNINYLPIDIFTNWIGALEVPYVVNTITNIVTNYIIPINLISTSVNQIGDRIVFSVTPSDEIIYNNTTGAEVNLYFRDFDFSYAFATIFSGSASGNGIIDYYLEAFSYDSLNVGQSTLVFTPLQVDDLTRHSIASYESKPKIINANGDSSTITEYYKGGVGNVSINDAYVTVPNGGYVKLLLQIDSPAILNLTAVCNTTIVITNLNIVEKAIGYPTSVTDGLFVHEAFTRLIQLMTSETNNSRLFYSELTGRTDSEFSAVETDGEAGYDFLTNGKLIRGYPNHPLNISFRDLFKTLDGIYNVGIAYDTVNQRFYLSNKSQFYNSNLLFDLGEVSGLKITPYDKSYFSKILSGQKKQVEYEEINGANEYNVPTEHALSIPIKDTLDITTPLNTDSVGQELARRKPYSLYSSEDTRYDELVYMTRTDGIETIQNGDSVSGFGGVGTYYNIAFTPRECIIRWSNWIMSGLWRSANKFVKFIKSQKNTNITYTNNNGDSVSEIDNIIEGEMNTRIFRPEMYEFEKPVSEEILSVLQIDPHGTILFSHDDIDYAMFLDVLEAEDYKKSGKWKGIAIEHSSVMTDGIAFCDDTLVQFSNDNYAIWSN